MPSHIQLYIGMMVSGRKAINRARVPTITSQEINMKVGLLRIYVREKAKWYM